MSSRNLRLDDAEKQNATAIFHILSSVKHHLNDTSFSELEQEAKKQLEAQGFLVDYVSIANANSLQQGHSVSEPLVGLVAASLNGVRLIDNMLLN
jgi:pantoate--beta-alanine ligase